MTSPAQRFPYVQIDPSLGAASALPFVPITLAYGQQRVSASGLVDSGATGNVLPYHLGLELGAVWEQQSVPVRLTGNLAASEARAILLTGSIGSLPPVRLAFAWTQGDRVPLILGQVNFFMEFSVSFFRADMAFELRSARASGTAVNP
jgi:hypothetical protein